MSEWIPLISNLGIAVCILMFLAVCLWRAAPWVAEKVILPYVERGLKLIDALIVSVVKQSETMELIGQTMKVMANAMEKSVCRAADIASHVGVQREIRGDGKDLGGGR